MKEQFNLTAPPETGLPPVLLDSDENADEYNLCVNGKALPTLTGIEVAGLYLALASLKAHGEQRAANNTAAPEEPRVGEPG